MPGYDNQDCIVEVELFDGGEQHGRLALDGTGVSLFEVEQAAIKARAAPESRITSAIRLVGVIRPLTEHGNPSFSRRFSHQGRHLSPRLGTSAVPQAVAAPARPGPAHGAWRLGRLRRVEASAFVFYMAEMRAHRADQTAAGYQHDILQKAARLKDVLPHDVAPCLESLDEVAAAKGARNSEILGGAFIRDADSANVFGKLSRYEIALARRLDRALAALERLQNARAGQPVPPPVVVDVDMSTQTG